MSQIIDFEKFLYFANKFALHEQWIQQGCSQDKRPSATIPGYLALASQNIDAYAFYRRSLLPYLSEARGNKLFFEEIYQIIAECENIYPVDMARFKQIHNTISEKDKGQWNNLFTPFQTRSLNHENCFKYQQKYEVEYVLIVLVQLRQMLSRNGLDETLNRFKNQNGNFKKGAMVDYIISGFQGYQEVKKMLSNAYKPKLRNIIGHNNYKITSEGITSLERDYIVTEKEFFESYICLQEVQNAILWLLSEGQLKNSELAQYGIPSIGFETENLGSQDAKMYIFQINSFRMLDQKSEWLKTVKFEIKDKKLITTLSKADSHHGGITEQLTSFLKKVNEQGQVRVSIIPVMPCFHNDCHPIETAWGTFCQYKGQFDIIVPAVVKW